FSELAAISTPALVTTSAAGRVLLSAGLFCADCVAQNVPHVYGHDRAMVWHGGWDCLRARLNFSTHSAWTVSTRMGVSPCKSPLDSPAVHTSAHVKPAKALQYIYS